MHFAKGSDVDQRADAGQDGARRDAVPGINPISHMAAFIRQVQALEIAEQARRGRDEFLGVPSFSPTRIHAPLQGEAETNNVIPSACQVTFDIRLIPGQTPEEIEAQLREIATHLGKTDERFSAEFTVLDARPPTATSRDEALVQTLDAAYRDLFNRTPTYGGVPGSTDGTILHHHAGIPIVTCGPGDTRLPHQVDEYLDIDQLLDRLEYMRSQQCVSWAAWTNRRIDKMLVSHKAGIDLGGSLTKIAHGQAPEFVIFPSTHLSDILAYIQAQSLTHLVLTGGGSVKRARRLC